MNVETFKQSLKEPKPPSHLPEALKALWWDAKGEWTKAHETAQKIENAAGAWIHAYLHRKEGDFSNAGYWYRQAGKAERASSLAEEWEEIVSTLLSAM